MAKKRFSLQQGIAAHIPLPICLLNREDRRIYSANPAFEALFGDCQEELAKHQKTLESLIYKKDFKKIEQRLEHLDGSQHIADELRVLTKDKSARQVEIALKGCEGEILCLFRDIEAQKGFEQQLKEQLEAEHGKVLQAVKGVIRVQQLLEKLHRMPAFFRELWKCEEEKMLIQKAATLMCHRRVFRYAYATILLREGDYLHIWATTKEQHLRRFHLQKQHKFAQVFRREKRIIAESTGEYALPLVSPSGDEGIVQVFLEETERALIAESDSLKQAHWDFLEGVCEFLGLLLYSLRSKPGQSDLSDNGRRNAQQTIAKKIEQGESFALFLLSADEFFETIALDLEIARDLMRSLGNVLENSKPPDSLSFVFGEGQFLLVIPANVYKSAPHEAEQLQRKMQQSNFSTASRQQRFSFSIGIATCSEEEPVTAGELLQRVVICARNAQKKDGSRICVWNGEIQEIPKRVSTKLR